MIGSISTVGGRLIENGTSTGMRLAFGLILLTMALPGGSAAEGRAVRRIVSMEYPLLAIHARMQGTIVVACGVDTGGNVVSVTTVAHKGVTAQGRAVLERAIRENLKEWLFERSSHLSEVTITFDFLLKGEFRGSAKTKFIVDWPDHVTLISQEVPAQIQ